jgi:hypothetical protein
MNGNLKHILKNSLGNWWWLNSNPEASLPG